MINCTSGSPSDVLNHSVAMEHLKYDADEETMDKTKPQQKDEMDEIVREKEEDGKENKIIKRSDGKLVKEEEQEEGVVKFHVYKAYWKAVGNILAPSVLIALFLMQGRNAQLYNVNIVPKCKQLFC